MIQVDTREQGNSFILEWFDENHIDYFKSKMVVGDYQDFDNPHLAIDRKGNMVEVCGNLAQQHERFRAECIRAQELHIHLIILIQDAKIKTLEDVKNWHNPRLRRNSSAMRGWTVYKIMSTMSAKYGVEWQFCTKQQYPKKILELLNIDV